MTARSCSHHAAERWSSWPSPPHRKHDPDVPLFANKLSYVCLCNSEASHQQPPPALLPLTHLLMPSPHIPPSRTGGWYLIDLVRRPSPPANVLTASLIAAEEIQPGSDDVYLPLMFHCPQGRGTKLSEACFSAFLWVITRLLRLSLTDDQETQTSL